MRIDPNVTPAEDAQFRLVPGLAGTGTVSFESVNYPGYYLRHFDYDFLLVRQRRHRAVRRRRHLPQVAGLADAVVVVVPVLQPPRPLHPPLRLPAEARPDHHRDRHAATPPSA